MSDDRETKPALALAEPPKRLLQRHAVRPGRWVWVLFGLQFVCLIGIAFQLRRRPTADTMVASADEREQLRATALALEERSLSRAAAETWRAYLRRDPRAADRAQLLYRVGRLFLESEDYGAAVVALVEAEQLAADDTKLQARIGPKIVECLRRLGRYGEVGRELSRQVEVDAQVTGRGAVLASFAGESFREADLDRLIERTVDRALALQPRGGLEVQREALLKQYQSREARQQMLQRLLERELFSRRARELKLDREDDFAADRQVLETELLANRLVSRELEKIQPTDVDIESFFAAQQDAYREPETATVTALKSASAAAAAAQLKQINSGDDFRRLVEASAQQEAERTFTLSRGRSHPELGDVSTVFELEVGAWTKSPVVGRAGTWLALLQSKTPGRVPDLTEIRLRVAADYRMRKQQELLRGLLAELMDRYDVRILDSAAQPAESGGGQKNRESHKPNKSE